MKVRNAMLFTQSLVLMLVITVSGDEININEYKHSARFTNDSSGIVINEYMGLKFKWQNNGKEGLNTPVTNEALAPDNDDCADAEPIGDTIFVFDNTGATEDGPINQPSSCYPETKANIWYRYTASITGPIEVAVDDTTYESQVLDPRIAVYEGSMCPNRITPPTPSWLDGGETIQDAAEITGTLPLAIIGTTVGYDHDYDLSCVWEREVNGISEFPDVVYSYSPGFNGTINVSVAGDITEDFFDPAFSILNSEGEELFCRNFPGLAPEYVLNFPVAEDETYYFVVSSGTSCMNYEGEFTLSIESPDYVILASSDDYYGSMMPRLFFEAIAGNEYLIEIAGREDREEGDGILYIGPAPPLAANDDCENATDCGILEPGNDLEIVGTTGRATMDCGGLRTPEVWISFTIMDSLHIEMDYCGSPVLRNGAYWALFEDCPCLNESMYRGSGGMNGCSAIEVQWHCEWAIVPPGTYYYPICAIQREGGYQLNIKSSFFQSCDENSMYGQNPSSSQNETAFFISEKQPGSAIFENFSGVYDSIKQVTWWGTNSYYGPDGWVYCDIDEMPFQIIFCRDDVASPGMPGDTVAIYDVMASPQHSFQNFNGYFQKKFVAELDPPLDMSWGWIAISGNNSIQDSCWFFWQDSWHGGSSWQYINNNEEWRLLEYDFAICFGDSAIAVSIDDEPVAVPYAYDLLQNYPNPFNATTMIHFTLPEPDEVTLTIYDILGRQVKMFESGLLSAGAHSIVWNGTDNNGEAVASGVYLYRLDNDQTAISKQMILIK